MQTGGVVRPDLLGQAWRVDWFLYATTCVRACVCVCSLWKQSTMMKKKFVSFAEQKLRVSVDETEITAIHNA